MNHVTEHREPKQPPLDAAYIESLRAAVMAKLYAAMQPALQELEQLDRLAELLQSPLLDKRAGYSPNPIEHIERLRLPAAEPTVRVVSPSPLKPRKSHRRTKPDLRTAKTAIDKKEYVGMTRQAALLKAIGLHPGLRVRQLHVLLTAGGLKSDAKDPENALWVPLAELTKKGLIRTVTDKEGRFKTYILADESPERESATNRSQIIVDILKKDGPKSTPDLVEKLEAMNHRFTPGRKASLVVGWTMNSLRGRGIVRQIPPKGDDGLTQWAAV